MNLFAVEKRGTEDIPDMNYSELKEQGIIVNGCTVTLPDEETKVWFMLRYGN